MNPDHDIRSEEFYCNALEIFHICHAESDGSLHVDVLMDKLSLHIEESDYIFLKNILDPGKTNPEISVRMLANALKEYSRTQKNKLDLDESINLKNASLPQDSDSGISSDGLQLLEDLQCELKEKSLEARKLRSELDYMDQQHDDIVNTITAERDMLRLELNKARDDLKAYLTCQNEFEETCEKLISTETSLRDAKRALDMQKKRNDELNENILALENEKSTLQDLLLQSKNECHRMNERYASRQSSLIEQNETLKTDCAEMSSKMDTQEQLMQQLIKEKVLIEMELKDVLNKSNQNPLRLDRSIDVSFCDDQLAQLDSLNADTSFVHGNLGDGDSFFKILKDEKKNSMSIYDELRFSIGLSKSRGRDRELFSPIFDNNYNESVSVEIQTDGDLCLIVKSVIEIAVQTEICLKDFNLETIMEKTEIKCQFGDTNTQNDEIDIVNKPINELIYTDFNITDLEINNNNSQLENFNLKKDFDDVQVQTEIYECSDCANKDMKIKELLTEVNTIKNEAKISINTFKEKINTLQELQKTEKIKYQRLHHRQKLSQRIKRNVADKSTECSIECTFVPQEKVKSTNEASQTTQTIDFTEILKTELESSNRQLNKMQSIISEYENSIRVLKDLYDTEKETNNLMFIEMGEIKRNLLNFSQLQESCLECDSQLIDAVSVSTQADWSCEICGQEKSFKKSIKKKVWSGIKVILAIFALLLFFAIGQVSQNQLSSMRSCVRNSMVPWSWFSVQDIVDFLFRIEYFGEVPV